MDILSRDTLRLVDDKAVQAAIRELLDHGATYIEVKTATGRRIVLRRLG